MKEEEKHKDAFELYFKLKKKGQSTTASIEQVAVQQKYNVTTVWKWKKTFKWDDREAVRNAQIRKRVEEKTNREAEDHIVKYLAIVNNAIGKYIKDIQEGEREPIIINNSNDLVKLINCGSGLLGYGEDKTVNDININLIQDKQEKLERLRRIEQDGTDNPIASPTKFNNRTPETVRK